MTEQLKKFVLAQKKVKVETVETYYKKLKKEPQIPPTTKLSGFTLDNLL